MAKEKKLAVTLKGVQLPAVYATDLLRVGEFGAIVVYSTPVTTAGVTEMKTDSVAIRFSREGEDISDDLLRKYQSAIPSLMSAYLGSSFDYAASNIIVGKVDYEFNNQPAIGILIVRVKIDGVIVAEAHYLGQSITAESEPAQFTWTLSPLPETVKSTVTTALPAIIQKELYGG